MKKILLTLTLLTSLSACSQLTHPVPYGLYNGMRDGAPEGTPEFRAGFKDGCESGLAAYGTYHYKAAHNYKYDDLQINNNGYHAAWRIGFRHCRWYVAEWTR